MSFLAPADAWELLTEPVPALHYQEGVVEAIIGLTHCQPYLLQAVASDLVTPERAEAADGDAGRSHRGGGEGAGDGGRLLP